MNKKQSRRIGHIRDQRMSNETIQRTKVSVNEFKERQLANRYKYAANGIHITLGQPRANL